MSSGDVATMLSQILGRLSAIESKLSIDSGSGSSPEKSSDTLPRSVKAFDDYLASHLEPFHQACNKLGGDAVLAGNNIKEAWQECRAVLLMAASCKEPTQTALPGLLSKLAAKLKAAPTLVKKNEWEKHTKTCSEGIGCLNWYKPVAMVVLITSFNLLHHTVYYLGYASNLPHAILLRALSAVRITTQTEFVRSSARPTPIRLRSATHLKPC
jgi:hypothetical protein